jgi:DNA-binding transcriptional LysR family regulator
MLAEHGLTRNVALSVPHLFAVPHIVSQSDLIMTTTERIGKAFSKQYPLKFVKHPLKMPGFGISMFWHNRTDGDESHQWFRDMMARVGNKLPVATGLRLRKPTYAS